MMLQPENERRITLRQLYAWLYRHAEPYLVASLKIELGATPEKATEVAQQIIDWMTRNVEV